VFGSVVDFEVFCPLAKFCHVKSLILKWHILIFICILAGPKAGLFPGYTIAKMLLQAFIQAGVFDLNDLPVSLATQYSWTSWIKPASAVEQLLIRMSGLDPLHMRWIDHLKRVGIGAWSLLQSKPMSQNDDSSPIHQNQALNHQPFQLSWTFHLRFYLVSPKCQS
jgi:hypothetical protein